MRAVANVTLRNNLIILNFLVYQVAAVIAAKANRLLLPKEFGEPDSKWMRQFPSIPLKNSFATSTISMNLA
jgi:hypothetical protein